MEPAAAAGFPSSCAGAGSIEFGALTVVATGEPAAGSSAGFSATGPADAGSLRAPGSSGDAAAYAAVFRPSPRPGTPFWIGGASKSAAGASSPSPLAEGIPAALTEAGCKERPVALSAGQGRSEAARRNSGVRVCAVVAAAPVRKNGADEKPFLALPEIARDAAPSRAAAGGKPIPAAGSSAEAGIRGLCGIHVGKVFSGLLGATFSVLVAAAPDREAAENSGAKEEGRTEASDRPSLSICGTNPAGASGNAMGVAGGPAASSCGADVSGAVSVAAVVVPAGLDGAQRAAEAESSQAIPGGSNEASKRRSATAGETAAPDAMGGALASVATVGADEAESGEPKSAEGKAGLAEAADAGSPSDETVSLFVHPPTGESVGRQGTPAAAFSAAGAGSSAGTRGHPLAGEIACEIGARREAKLAVSVAEFAKPAWEPEEFPGLTEAIAAFASSWFCETGGLAEVVTKEDDATVSARSSGLGTMTGAVKVTEGPASEAAGGLLTVGETGVELPLSLAEWLTGADPVELFSADCNASENIALAFLESLAACSRAAAFPGGKDDGSAVALGMVFNTSIENCDTLRHRERHPDYQNRNRTFPDVSL